ncbi:MAG: FmdB family zinc ribbon protein [Planctomycetota bacterium]|jgi:putative FmdB family regulatory protein
MPIYEYDCLQCGGRFEALLRTSDEVPSCPECGSEEIKKVFSLFASPAKGAEGPAPAPA